MNTPSRMSQHEPHSYDCPSCGAPIELAEREHVDGNAVVCPHCREEATLVGERVPHSDRVQWSLVEQVYDDDRP